MKTRDIEALQRPRAKPSKIKLDPVDQPVRTARTVVHLYNGTQYHTIDILLKGHCSAD